MMEGVGVLGEGGSPGEGPIPEESPLNLVLYMHLRIFAYSSNILIANFGPMGSMLASGTWKFLRFVLRPCSLRERASRADTLCC